MSSINHIDFLMWLKEYVIELYLDGDGEELRELQKYAEYHGAEEAFDDAVDRAREKQKAREKVKAELV